MTTAKIIVVGGGVAGLTVAIRLQESGAAVRVWTREPSDRTTSAVAAALWYPYLAEPRDRVRRWALASYGMFRTLAFQPDTGVAFLPCLEVLKERGTPDPWWSPLVDGFRRAGADELPSGYTDGYAFRAPVMEMPRYLPYLEARLRRAGGRILLREVQALDEALAEAPVVVNCSGLGARQLAEDPEVFPVRGQVVRVTNPGLERVLIDEMNPSGPTYVVPRSADVVLGGTADHGEELLDEDPAATEAIRARCGALEPRLEAGSRLGVSVGARPARREVRLEAEGRDGERLLIHDYGHGGCGVTLSWGCADEVLSLLRKHRWPS